ncbi:pseudouridylate synthase [Treponema phagedenis F0421]|nr:pseudouridylate synthase [Treponema phagedenis F0421]
MRVDKILASNGYGSRKDVRVFLKKNNCCINGVRCINPAQHIDPTKDTVTVNGISVQLRTSVYIMLHKPAGCVSSTKDPIHKTVMDFLPAPFNAMDLFPIGRLDIDTEGLLIITNDGNLTHSITAPKSNCVKTYYLELERPLTETEIHNFTEKLAQGILLHTGYTCLPAALELTENIHTKNAQAFLIHITEGKYHQIKKMCTAFGVKLTYLKRVSMAGLELDPSLAAGNCRELTSEEITLLYRNAAAHKSKQKLTPDLKQ